MKLDLIESNTNEIFPTHTGKYNWCHMETMQKLSATKFKYTYGCDISSVAMEIKILMRRLPNVESVMCKVNI